MRQIRALILLCFLFLALSGRGATESLARMDWTIDGVSRQALVYTPLKAKTEVSPVIFAFHGHGGSMLNAAHMFGYQSLWPEAIVVYMQGLNTPGRLTDPEGEKPGWQFGIGEQNDRDLKFFDGVLAKLKKDYSVDEKRIYATGHSNGGGFTYLLWAARGDVFAAMAPSGATAPPPIFRKLKPKPVLHVAGESDPLVKFAWQKQTMDELRRLNQCGEGQTCGKWCTLYPSKTGTPMMTFIHAGGHQFPSEAPAVIVKFFKEHARP
jgi:polyhydroxybutyrate depolymerase